MKVLVADDDLTTRSVLKAILSKWGYDVEEASDGNEAWRKLQADNGPKLAVLDWMMPGQDGIEICRKASSLENWQPPYIILLTSRDKNEDIVEGLHAGANDYILKPFNIEELQARVQVGQRMVELQDKLNLAIENQKKQALTDSLTSIPNRRGILRRLEDEMSRARRQKRGLWIAILDIDHFKQVNDTFGHLTGDLVLKECVRRISGTIRAYDIFGRYGGEEFLLILTVSPEESPKTVVERIRVCIADEKISAEGNEVQITLSQGVVKWNFRDSVDGIIGKADDALYKAKANGRNRIEWFPSE